MKPFIANFKNELYKLSTKKKYVVFAIIGILICLFKVLSAWVVTKLSRGMIPLQIEGMAMGMLPFFAEILIPLMMFMAVTDLFCSEFHDNSIKAVLMRPISRSKVMLSKIFACFTMAIIQFAVVFVTCTLLEAIFGTPAKLGESFLVSLSSYAIDLVPLFVLILMAVLINMLTKGSTLAMFLCFLVYALMKYCNYFVPSLSAMLFTSYNQWHKLWIGSRLPFHAMISKILLLVGSGILFYTGGYYLFDKKEI
jgi:ABC-2 type transport system permease protein